MFRFIFPFIVLISIAANIYSQTALVKGSVINSQTSEPLSDCNILVKETLTGTSSNFNGEFIIDLPFGDFTLQFSYIGFETYIEKINLKSSKTLVLDVKLVPVSLKEDQITVTGKKSKPNTVEQSIIAKEIKRMPNLYNDVLRSVQVLAGVSTNNELSSGYNVRGGSFDENLIYLNGFEIYRPFLLKQGIEENQTLINPGLVSSINFYNGNFPSRLGDRMSSALEVKYADHFNNTIHGSFYADLLNTGILLNNSINDFNWSIAGRYSYPDAFLKQLQTTGDYSPSFSDFQFSGNYTFGDNRIELLGLLAENKFFFEPESWIGNFGGFTRGDYRELKIDYTGRNEYRYVTSLIGIKSINKIFKNTKLLTSAAYYSTNETEQKNISGNIFYNENPDQSHPVNEYVKTRDELVDNKLDLSSYRLSVGLMSEIGNHILSTGAEYRIVDLSNRVNEKFYELGDSTLLQTPYEKFVDQSIKLNSLSIFLEDEIKITRELKTVAGLRYLHYDYTNENLFSPRLSLLYEPTPLTTFNIGWGYYYQPPFINELKNPEIGQLKSQRAIHYTLGIEHLFREDFKFAAEVYYKDLDNLIPFYFDELKMVYLNGNTREGYAYGLDMQIDAELVDDMRSIIGYSYLDSKERDKGTTKYQRRLLDQTHTIQIFLQDKFKKHPNWQSHVRFLFGSGQLYYNRIAVTNPLTGDSYIDVNINNPAEYFLYFRVDMGLSASFDIFQDYKLLFVAEVLNVFDHLNYGSYDWVEVLEEFNAPVRIPRVLSQRFFNIRMEFEF